MSTLIGMACAVKHRPPALGIVDTRAWPSSYVYGKAQSPARFNARGVFFFSPSLLNGGDVISYNMSY